MRSARARPEPSTHRGLAQHAEALGFEGITLGEHLSQRTTRLQVLTTVYVLPLRDPFNAAKAIATAAHLSEGRVKLGVGVGWQQTELEVVGHDFKTRGRRTDEMLDSMKALWTGKTVEFEGEFYHVHPLQMSPGIEQLIEGLRRARAARGESMDAFANRHLE